MIVKMKKLAVIVQERDCEDATKKMRALGILHVEHQNLPQGADITSLSEDISLLSEAINILSSLSIKNPSQRTAVEKPVDWKCLARHIIDSYKRQEQLKDFQQVLLNRIAEWQSWGDFDPEAIHKLAKKNIIIKLYEIPSREIENIPQELFLKKISEKSGLVNCVVAAFAPFELPFAEKILPKSSLSKTRARIEEDNRIIELVRRDLLKHSVYLSELSGIKNVLLKELELREAIKGMGKEGSLAYICGFVPQDAAALIEKTASLEHWAFFMRDPKDDEVPPTLIRSPRWISLITPVFKLLEIVPGYRELDISPLFLIFLSLFFGMIIGDAGYGAAYFLLTLFLHQKLKAKVSDTRIFYLLYLFSSCAILWGLLTGTVFGQEWYLKIGAKALLPVLNNTSFLQAFCFFLGAFHLTLGHLWQGLRKAPSLNALSDLGWICVLWAAFFIARTLILDDPFPQFGNWLIGIGLFFVIFFSNPQKNILKTISSGLGTVALSLMNNFTDVVSYIRLFAIGLATVAIADTVNTLASGLGSNAIVAKIIIVSIGHTINIILGPMSVLVHGIRLNVLEFSSHAGLSWSGTAYKPLKV
jgi:V/A-type H+-transporting ATPase subunit I